MPTVGNTIPPHKTIRVRTRFTSASLYLRLRRKLAYHQSEQIPSNTTTPTVSMPHQIVVTALADGPAGARMEYGSLQPANNKALAVKRYSVTLFTKLTP